MIALNCDVGEGSGVEHLLFPYISSCSISCGAHAGSKKEIAMVLQQAVEHNVNVGAHPSYPDRLHFGRRVMDISNSVLQQSLEAQLLLFKESAMLQNVTVHHIKPHGALYTMSAVNHEIASVILNAVQNIFGSIKVYVPYGSEIEKAALQNGFEIVYEAFGDRNYNDDLTLVSRSHKNAIITNPKEVLTHILRMAKTSKVLTINGIEKEIKASTFCLHGDAQNTVEILKYIHKLVNLNKA